MVLLNWYLCNPLLQVQIFGLDIFLILHFLLNFPLPGYVIRLSYPLLAHVLFLGSFWQFPPVKLSIFTQVFLHLLEIMNIHQLFHWLIILIWLLLVHFIFILKLLQCLFKHFIRNLGFFDHYIFSFRFKFSTIRLKTLLAGLSFILFPYGFLVLFLSFFSILLLLYISSYHFCEEIIFKLLVAIFLTLKVESFMNLF